MKKAVLVSFSIVTRVIVDNSMSDSEVIEMAAIKCSEKLSIEPCEHLSKIEDDLECPFEEGFDD